jgi:hypothetical protein
MRSSRLAGISVLRVTVLTIRTSPHFSPYQNKRVFSMTRSPPLATARVTESTGHVILSPPCSSAGEGSLQLSFEISSPRRTAEMLLPQGGISMTGFEFSHTFSDLGETASSEGASTLVTRLDPSRQYCQKSVGPSLAATIFRPGSAER